MEITSDVVVSIEEETLLDMHSVLNVLNVVVLELLNLASEVGESPPLQTLHEQTVETGSSTMWPNMRRGITSCISASLPKRNLQSTGRRYFRM